MEDLRVNTPERLIGATGRFEVKRWRIVFDRGITDIEIKTNPRLLGFKGIFTVKKGIIVFEVDFFKSLPKELARLTEKFLIRKEGKVFEPFKEASLKNILIAAEYGFITEVKWMLDKGVKPDETVIELAAKNGHTKIVQLLLDTGAPIDWKALAWATSN